MKDEEESHSQDELARLQAENARLRATIDRLERERRQQNPASAQTRARTKKILRILMWLFALAFSNMVYGVALVVTISLTDPGTSAPTPWVWVFLFVFITPLLLLFFAPLIAFYDRKPSKGGHAAKDHTWRLRHKAPRRRG